MKNEKLKKIIITAVFSAIAFLFTFVFKFKVMFLTFDFKDAVIAVVSLALGPLYGVACAGITAFLEFLSISDTGPYGLLMNFISSGTFAFAIGIIYKYNRTFKGAILAAAVSVLTLTSVMMVANYFITPLYMGVSTSQVAELIPTVLLPFNLAKALINAASTIIIYKPVTKALKRVGLMRKDEVYGKVSGGKTAALYCVSGAVIILTVLFIIFILKGGFSIVA